MRPETLGLVLPARHAHLLDANVALVPLVMPVRNVSREEMGAAVSPAKRIPCLAVSACVEPLFRGRAGLDTSVSMERASVLLPPAAQPHALVTFAAVSNGLELSVIPSLAALSELSFRPLENFP